MRQDGYETTFSLTRVPIRPLVSGLLGILGIILLARFLTGFVLRADPYYIYVAAIAIVVAMAISQKLELAVVVYAFLAPMLIGASPGYEGTRSGYQPFVLPSQVGLVLISGIWFITAFLKRRQITTRCSLYLPLLAFLFVCTLSILSSYIIWDYNIPLAERRIMNQVSEVGLFALCGLAFWMGASAIQRKEWIKVLFWPVLLIGLYNAFLRISGLEPPIQLSRGDFITAFADVFVFSRLLFVSDSRWIRVGLWLALLTLLTGTYLELTWVSGWLTASIGMLIVLACRSRTWFAAAAVIVCFAVFIYPGVYHIVYTESRHEGDMDRLVLWQDSIKMANSVNPVLGIGPGDYMAYSQMYATLWYGQETYDTAHSSYAQMIAETGYLGLLAFLWLVAAGIRTGIRSVRKVTQDFKWFAVGSTAVFAAISFSSLVGDYLLPSRTNGGLVSFGASVYVWLLLGATVAAVRLGKPAANTEESEYRPLTEAVQ